MYRSGILSEDVPVSETFMDDYEFAQTYSLTDNQSEAISMSATTSDLTMEDTKIQWTKLTHSTLLIGYGV